MRKATQLIDLLPAPETVRRQLADAVREADLLRGLLKLSERAQSFRRCDDIIDQQRAEEVLRRAQ